jgi:hypothetical protein
LGDGGDVGSLDYPAVESVFDLEGDTTCVGSDDGDAFVDRLEKG